MLALIEVELARVAEQPLSRALFSSAMHAFWETVTSLPLIVIFELWQLSLDRYVAACANAELSDRDVHMHCAQWQSVLTQCLQSQQFDENVVDRDVVPGLCRILSRMRRLSGVGGLSAGSPHSSDDDNDGGALDFFCFS